MLLLGRVKPPEPPDLRRQMTVPDKLCKSDLLCLGGRLIIMSSRFLIFLQQRKREDHKAYTYGGKKKPRERTDIYHVILSGESI